MTVDVSPVTLSAVKYGDYRAQHVFADVSTVTAAAVRYGDYRANEVITPLQALYDTDAKKWADEKSMLLAEIAQLKGAPPVRKTIYGCSGGANQAATIALLKPKLLRTYDSGQQAAVPRTLPQLFSGKPDMAKLAAGDKVEIARTYAYFAPLADIPGQYVCIGHETDNNDKQPGAIVYSPDIYKAAWKTFVYNVVSLLNSARKNKIRTVAIDTGSADHELWYVPDADVIGSDPYSTGAVTRLASFAKTKGKPFGIGEWGYSTTGIVATDDQFAARIASDSKQWVGAEFVLWWASHANSPVDYSRPKTVAAWVALTNS